MIAKVDAAEIPENDPLTAWEKKRDVPREAMPGHMGRVEYVELKRTDRNFAMAKKQEIVNAANLGINLTTQTERDLEDQEAKERRKVELAKQNQLPDWHSHSAIGIGKSGEVKTENGDVVVKKQEDEDGKPVIPDETNMQDEVAAYMAEMERERVEAERKAQEEERDDDDDDDDGDDFEDVVGTSNIGTPLSSQQGGMKQDITPRSNGLKRELDFDGDSVSGTDTNANTPMDSFEHKRIKLEDGHRSQPVGLEQETPTPMAVTNGVDSEEDEDFEDV